LGAKLSDNKRMPAIFVGHGSPMNAISSNRYTQAWAARAALMPRPRAILSVSAHWFTRGTMATAMLHPKTIHDFGGFPQALYQVQYPAPGNPDLAAEVQALLKPANPVLDHAWGLDHGTWQVAIHMFPRADIPIVQLSIDATQAPQFHYELGKRLSPLRESGVLILGSGNIVHNLGLMVRREDAPAFDWSARFSEHVRGSIARRDHAALIDYSGQGRDSRLSVPTPEHYLPLLYVLGTQRDVDPADIFVEGSVHGSLDMMCVAF
jgi:4,5-DOPA dioxygenase extradiol